MIRIIAFIICMLPAAAMASTYTFKGKSKCSADNINYSTCFALLSFEINPSDFGKHEIPIYSERGIEVYLEGEKVITGNVWFDPDSAAEGGCTDWCATASTDAVGNLQKFGFNCFDCGEDVSGWWTRNEGGLYSFNLSEGSYRGELSLVPLPAALPLFAAGLLVIGYRARSKLRT